MENSVNSTNSVFSNVFYYFILLVFISFVLMIIIFYINYSVVVCGPDGKIGFLDYLSYVDIYAPLCKEPEAVRDYVEREIKQEDEVFHIKNQKYTYPEAYEKCKAYGAKLATYSQLADFYNKGGEFNTYGWSDGQRAYYPVQPETYVKMLKDGKENPPPPGVNGGKFEKGFKFGVNCYGVKPKGEVIQVKKTNVPNADDVCISNPAACKILTSDNISGFNSNKWSIWD